MMLPKDLPAPNHRDLPPPRREGGGGVIMLVIFVVAGLIVYLAPIWLVNKSIETAGETAGEVAKIFRPTVTVTTFNEWRELNARATGGNILEVATALSSERFSRTSNVAMFGRVLPGTTTVSEITVPATYRFYIDLNEEWNLLADERRLVVVAPVPRPTLPVAFDTREMRKKTESGWARWDGAEHLVALEKELTAKLVERASHPATLEKIREESRAAVARFVRKWLLDKEAWGKGRFEEIVVVFPGEEDKPVTSLLPSLRLDSEREPAR